MCKILFTNRYFDMLEEGRIINLDGFIDFILEEYKNALEEVSETGEHWTIATAWPMIGRP